MRSQTVHAQVHAQGAPAPYQGARYAQGVIAGPFVFVSGMIALDPAVGEILVDTMPGQIAQIFSSIAAVLEAAGSGIERLVKVVVYLADLADYAEMNEHYQRYIVGDIPPVRTTVQALLPAAARIEIDVTALR
jgi:2-iminobutanoate/2-iminopropanoate deaminase